jgi:iron complex transport system permease protein
MVYTRTALVSLSVFLGMLLLIALCLGVLVGVTTYSPSELIFNPDAQDIVLRLRLPRVLCSVLVGAGLAAVGMSYQALFRNYLASPFTLGVSSGAALAASTALVFGSLTARGGIDIGVCALGGALISIVVIVAIARRLNRRGGFGVSAADSSSLLLVGIVFSFFCSSVMTLIQYVADASQLFQVTRWMMGGIPSAGWGDLVVGGVCAGVIIAWLWGHTRELDLMLFGDDLAAVKGLDPRRFSYATFVLSSFLVGWVVALCGVIGFVGIVVPAIARILVGVAHSRVLPISLLLGALLVVVCDLLGRVVIAPFEIPAGVFTSVLGGPAFVALLLGVGRGGRKVC